MATFKKKGVTYLLTGTKLIDDNWFHDIKDLTNNKHYFNVPDYKIPTLSYTPLEKKNKKKHKGVDFSKVG